jgi:cobalt/nickel transport system ATP-binding protein
MGLIELRRISFAYPDGRKVLDLLDFELDVGERVGLIGPNGSGKTTLFHVIMGLLTPDSGSIRVFGREMRKEKDFRSIRSRVGLLFQDADDQLFSPTVLEDVAFGPLNQGKPPAEAREIALDTLRSLRLEGFEDRVTHKLSGGEKKLVSLATVLAMRPEVLLLDEPTTGLDSETTERIIEVLSGIEIAYVFISHNMDFLARTTDRIHAVENGRILLDEEKVVHTHVHAHGHGRVAHSHVHAGGYAHGEDDE